MADTYGVTPADIAAELPGLFPGGFSVSTVPTLAQVTSFITVADLRVTIAIQNASGALPAASDRLAPLAKRAIIERVKGQIIRIVYTGNAPADVESAARPYEDLAKDALAALTDLETQAAGAGDPPNRMVTSSTVPSRDLLIDDDVLGPAPHGRNQSFGNGTGIDRGRF
jgi:hypothetical protein